LLEYREILERKTTVTIAENVIELILLLPTTIQTVTHFNFQLIDLDKEDNKFIDCAVASNAHFLVSNDNHFNILKTIEFPVVSLLTLQEFEDLYKAALTK
jgi:putative PIN family toxin of toxin-antitoxin system